jgi:hypothetical protein
MSDTITPISFLDEDLSSVDTSSPVFKGNQVLELEIVDVFTDKTKDGLSDRLTIKSKTVKSYPGTKETIKDGFPITQYIGLTPMTGRLDKKDWGEDDIKKSIAKFLEAVEGKATRLTPMDRFKGKRFLVKAAVTAPTAQYPNEGNQFTYVRQ